MHASSTKQLFRIVLLFDNEVTLTVKVKASSLEVAERRALKRNPRAIGVKHNA